MLKRSVHERTQLHIMHLAKQLNWRIVDLRYSDKMLPEGLIPDGALIDELWDTPLAQQIHQVGCPMVRQGRMPNPHDDIFPAIACDLPQVGRMAAEHFASRNFRQVGFVSYNKAQTHQPDSLYPHFHARATALAGTIQHRTAAGTHLTAPQALPSVKRSHRMVNTLSPAARP